MSAFICSPKHFAVLGHFAAQRQFGGSQNVYNSQLERLVASADEGFRQAFSGIFNGKGVRELSDTQYADAVANLLYFENIRSVLHRYPNDDLDSAPGPIDKPAWIRTGKWLQWQLRVEPIDILKACDCLEYQSCETEDYRETSAYKVLELIRGSAISLLPGYEDAAWEIAA